MIGAVGASAVSRSTAVGVGLWVAALAFICSATMAENESIGFYLVCGSVISLCLLVVVSRRKGDD